MENLKLEVDSLSAELNHLEPDFTRAAELCTDADTGRSRSKSFGIFLQQKNASSNSEAHQQMQQIVRNASLGFEGGINPTLIEDCTGGTYFLRSPTRNISAIFKPQDEEPYALNNPKKYVRSTSDEDSANYVKVGIKRGIRVGEAAIREYAVYLLDQNHGAGVPLTTMAVAYHPKFHVAHLNQDNDAQDEALVYPNPKVGSLQEYLSHKCTSEDICSKSFAVASVHSIAILDIRVCNQDRHSGNILVREDNSLIPIDHGFCLPSFDSADETQFVWMEWEQSKLPMSDEHRKIIASLDSFQDAARLVEMEVELPPSAILTLHLSTILLKKCALHFDMSLFSIGKLMCRSDFEPDEASVFENLIAQTSKHISDFSPSNEQQVAEFCQVFQDLVLEYLNETPFTE